MKSVLVVIPTIGSPELKDSIQSVLEQDYENVEYLIVVDGSKYEEAVKKIVSTENIVVLLHNVGAGGWYGHRIIAGFSHLVNHDYVIFLDEDNMLEPNHVSSLVKTIESGDYDWVYSLRKIVSKEGEYLCEDDCESLGRWPIAGNEANGNMVDTNCYLYKADFIRATGHLWDYGWGADRRYYKTIKEVLNHDKFRCSGESTLKYRLGGNEGSVKKEFFTTLNEEVRKIYGDKPLPWRDKP